MPVSIDFMRVRTIKAEVKHIAASDQPAFDVLKLTATGDDGTVELTLFIEPEALPVARIIADATAAV